MLRRIVLAFLIPVMFLLTSCWDKTEIEKTALVLAIAIDQADKPGMLSVTFQIALPQAFGGEQGGGKQPSVDNVQITAKDLATAQADLLKAINWTPILEHCRVILFGEKYARSGIEGSLDFLFRSPEIRRKTVVVAVQGEAGKVLDIQPKLSKAAGLYINDIITQNANVNFEFINLNDITGTHRNYARQSDTLFSRVIPMKDSVEVSGAAIIKNNRLIGWLDGKEIEGARWLLGNMKGGAMTTDLPQSIGGGKAAIHIFTTESSVKPEFVNGKLVVHCKASMEGDITEIQNTSFRIKSSQDISTLEKVMKKQLYDRIEHAFLVARDKYDADVFELDRRMENYYPNYWDKHQNDWHKVFKTAALDLDVRVKIRRVGVIEK